MCNKTNLEKNRALCKTKEWVVSLVTESRPHRSTGCSRVVKSRLSAVLSVVWS